MLRPSRPSWQRGCADQALPEAATLEWVCIGRWARKRRASGLASKHSEEGVCCAVTCAVLLRHSRPLILGGVQIGYQDAMVERCNMGVSPHLACLQGCGCGEGGAGALSQYALVAFAEMSTARINGCSWCLLLYEPISWELVRNREPVSRTSIVEMFCLFCTRPLTMTSPSSHVVSAWMDRKEAST